MLEYILEVSVFGRKEKIKSSRSMSKEVNKGKRALSEECFCHGAEYEPDWYVSNGSRQVSQPCWSERQFSCPESSNSLMLVRCGKLLP